MYSLQSKGLSLDMGCEAAMIHSEIVKNMSGRHGNQRKIKKAPKPPAQTPVLAEAPCQEHPDNKKGDYIKEANNNPPAFLKDWRVDAAILVSIFALVAYFTQVYFMRKTMRVDQRAWVSVILPDEFPSNGTSIQIAFQIGNTGKTPGKNIGGDVVATVLNKGDVPSLGDFSVGHPHNRLHPIGVIFPGSRPIPMTIPVVKYAAQSSEIIVPDETLQKDITEGKRFIIFYGRMTYCDVFGIQHWTQFCTGSGEAFKGDPLKDCLKFNDVDPNED